MADASWPDAQPKSPVADDDWCPVLASRLPFAQMQPVHVRWFVAASRRLHFAGGDVVLEPASGPVTELLCVCRGRIHGRHGVADTAGPLNYGPGDVFAVGSVLGGRAVTATYTAQEETWCLALPAEQVQELAALSEPFSAFLNRRAMDYLALARKAAQAQRGAQALAEQSLEARLGSLPERQPLSCTGHTPLRDALGAMHERRVGSIVIVDETQAPRGIVTRFDILGRVTLPQRSLQDPVASVMSEPVHSLSVGHTLQDAALLMARHGIRHLPVTADGRLVNVVSERDLFALQRLSLHQLSAQIHAAGSQAALQHMAEQIRSFARKLLQQGVQARQLTELVSHLNDLLTERLLHLVAARRGMDLTQACWLSFGSEGRGEQTIATDQDNGLLFASDAPDADRPRWLALALEVNEALDACGYPLCKGGIMASRPACCLTLVEWHKRFERWIEQGSPEDLLKASIFFDLRALAGQVELAQPLRALVAQQPARVPRFLKQMAINALRQRPPLNWRGALDTQELAGRPTLDLKLQGTAVFVDAARLYALAHGLGELGTRQRLEAAAPLMRITAQEGQAWVTAFEFLQMLRLQAQTRAPIEAGNANRIDVSSLDDIERRMLLESLRVARRLQQRMELDYQR